MSRSWYQGACQLIADVRETFRLHFKQVVVKSLDVDVEAWDVAYDFGFSPQCYGGRLISQSAKVHRIALYFSSGFGIRMPLSIACRVTGENTLFHPPPLRTVPCYWDAHHLVHSASMLPAMVPIRWVTEVALPWPNARTVPTEKWLLRRSVGVSQWMVERLKAPQVKKTAPLRSKIQLFPILKKSLPVQRKPIPPHRFSSAHRQKFRELLARRAQLPVGDMQIVGVYDRIFLGLFQSLSQKEDGTLVCTPKNLSEPGLREKETVSVYLVVGKSFKAPGKLFQVVMPMSELES